MNKFFCATTQGLELLLKGPLVVIAVMTAILFAAPGSAQSLKSYQGPNFSFNYPSDWVLTRNSDQSVSVAPKGDSTRTLAVGLTSAYGSDLASFFTAVETQIQNEADSIQGCTVSIDTPFLNGYATPILWAYFVCEQQLGGPLTTLDERVEVQSLTGEIAEIVTILPAAEQWAVSTNDPSNQLSAIRKSLKINIGTPTITGTWNTPQISSSSVDVGYGLTLRTYQGQFTFESDGSFIYTMKETAQTDVAPWTLTVRGSYTLSVPAGSEAGTLSLVPSSSSMVYTFSGVGLSSNQESLEFTRLSLAGLPGSQGGSYQMTWLDQNGTWDMQQGGIEVILGSGSVAANPPPATVPLAGSLRFVPLTPCRVLDTRNPTGTFGGPELAAQATREFDLPNGQCGVPSSAAAYSLNVTVVPDGPLGYLAAWPSGQLQPGTSILNSDGRVKANAAVVPAGTNGGITFYASDATHVIVDIDGYFDSAAAAPQGYEFYPLTPCRLADTRNPAGLLGGPYLTAGVARSFPVMASACNVPASAQAYSLNFTAVPHHGLGFLTAWPTGQAQPLASVLNASTGHVTANAAMIPAGASGEVSAYASDDSDLVIDINGYFAPAASGGLLLYTLAPCRLLDTRNSGGSPFSNTLTVTVAGQCGVSSTAQAFLLNATVIPNDGLGYLSLWPDGQPQPLVSTLNADGNNVTSNAAIVPSVNGSIDAFASNTTHLVLDISSYFAP